MIGQSVSHYRVVDRIGGGGMGVVYRAEDTTLGRSVAIKLLPPELASDGEALQRFRREARAASALNHPHICTIYEFGEHAGQPFLVMEYLSGETLADRLARGPLPLDDVLRLGAQVADALAAAHAAAIIHRDVKPANLFVTARGDVKVLDFGLAKTAGPHTGAAGSEDATATLEHLTGPGSALGTVAYMAPEQARGTGTDGRCDLFALGATLYEMATGRRAFAGTTAPVVFEAILGRDPPPPSRSRPELPPAFDALVAKALEKDPALRYQSAVELRADLERLRRDRASPPAVPVPGRSRRLRPRWWAWAWAAGGVLATIAASIAWWVLRPRPPAGWEPPAGGAVAVLPFEQLGGGTELAYLRLALPDEITTALTYAPALSVRPFEPEIVGGEELDAGEAARRLRAGLVVTGHYAPEAGHLAVTLQAIDVAEDRLVWRDGLTVPLADMLSLREAVSARVRHSLLPALGVASGAAAAGWPTDAAAYEEYLRSLALSTDPLPNQRAVAMLEQAVERDPGFALAWAALAERRSFEEQYAGGGALARRRSKEAARRALALDPGLLTARQQLILLETEEGDLAEAYRNGLALLRGRGDSAEAHFTLSYVLRYGGMLEEAQRHCETALALDPGSPRLRSCAFAWIRLGQLDRATRFIALDAGSYWSTVITAAVALRRGDAEGLRREIERLPPSDANRRLFAACADRTATPEPWIVEEFTALWSPDVDPEPGYWGGAVLALCGLPERALERLGQSVARGLCAQPAIDRDPAWAGLRDDPRMAPIRAAATACRERFAAAMEAADTAA